MSKYSNIDQFYSNNRELLLENDEYRLCKSIPRNIGAYVDKFADYYRIHGKKNTPVSEDIVTKDILKLTKWSDVVTTAKRIMKEFGFLEQLDKESYTMTSSFDYYLSSGEKFETFLIEKLENVTSMNNMTMVYNSIICALREGYQYNKILVFPDSYEKFAKSVTNPDDRYNFRKRVFDIYGFAGRYHDYNRDDYTPNANYRIMTVLSSLDFIDQVESDFDDIRAYQLTNRANKYLELLNKNLGGVSDEKFEELIKEENNFRDDLDRLAEKYGVNGTMSITHDVRLPQVQEAFRDRLVQEYGCKCMMCNISNKEMLIASHIKRASEENIYGKADYNNGFLLCANHDKLFDRYLISFGCLDGKIMISKSLTHEEREICMLDENFTLPDEYLTDERTEYLMNHNAEFLKREDERN